MARREDYDIVLRATDQTSAAFASAQRNVEGLKGAVGMLKSGVVGMLSVFGAREIIDFVKEAVAALDEIGTVAKRVGVTTDALQALRFMAEQNGAQIHDADAALQKFADTASKAGTNSNYLGKVFQANNISIKDQSGAVRSAADLLVDYARLVTNATSPQDKLRLSVEAFGRQAGPLMVGTLEDITKNGLQGVIDKVKDFGAIADKHLIEKADEIEKRWKQISATFGVKFKSAMVEAVDGIKSFVSALEELIRKDYAKDLGEFATGLLLLKYGGGKRLTNSDAASFYDAVGFKKPEAAKTKLPADNDAVQKQIDSIAKHVAVMRADAEAVDATAGEHEKLRVQMQLLEVAQQHHIPISGEYAKKIADIADRAKAAADALAAAKLQSDLIFERAQLGRTPIEQTVAEKLRSARISADSAAGIDLGNQIRINEALKTSKDLATNFADSMAQSMLQGKNATEALKSALMNLESQLLSMVMRGLVNQIFSAFMGGGVLPGGAPLGRGGIGHAAAGGDFGAGDWSWVGENGPELVRFGRSASVLPSGTSHAAAAPKLAVQVNNYHAADTEARQSTQDGPDGPRVVIDIVKRAYSSGAFDNANRSLYSLRRQKVR